MRLAIKGIAARLLVLVLLLAASRVQAHDLWADATAVPPWVKGACCGAADMHHLMPDAVHARPDGWHVDGVHAVIPYGTELPSQDGDYWIFYADLGAGRQSNVYCFFAPPAGL